MQINWLHPFRKRWLISIGFFCVLVSTFCGCSYLERPSKNDCKKAIIKGMQVNLNYLQIKTFDVDVLQVGDKQNNADGPFYGVRFRAHFEGVWVAKDSAFINSIVAFEFEDGRIKDLPNRPGSGRFPKIGEPFGGTFIGDNVLGGKLLVKAPLGANIVQEWNVKKTSFKEWEMCPSLTLVSPEIPK